MPPAADVPVVQLSIDETPAGGVPLEVGRKLAPLREEGVLVVGSGNIVHNLHAYAWGRHSREPFDWAVRFESAAREIMLTGEFRPLIDYDTLGRDALLSIPTPTISCRCSTFLAATRRGTVSAFQSKASMAGPFQCCPCGLDRSRRNGT